MHVEISISIQKSFKARIILNNYSSHNEIIKFVILGSIHLNGRNVNRGLSFNFSRGGEIGGSYECIHDGTTRWQHLAVQWQHRTSKTSLRISVRVGRNRTTEGRRRARKGCARESRNGEETTDRRWGQRGEIDNTPWAIDQRPATDNTPS